MRFLFLFFAFIFSANSYSADYSWLVSYSHQATGSSPADACTVWASIYTSDTRRDWTAIFKTASKVAEDRFVCFFDQKNKKDGFIMPNSISADVYRSGDSCPFSTLYNSATGACDPDPCASTAGNVAYHLSATGKTRPTSSDPWPAGAVTGSPTMCSGSCQYSISQSTTVKCGTLKGGDPLSQYCLFQYSGTGQACAPGDPSQNNGTTAPVPPTDPNDPTDPANNCGPTHVWSGSVCVPKLDPDATDPGTGGGDPGTGGGDPGTGGGDPGTGGGDPGTGGGDPGTGGGDPGDDGPDDEGDVVKGEACDLDLTCEGDAIQCAMLRQQKADRCNWQIDEKQTKQIVDSFTGDKYKLGESSTDLGASFSNALNSPRFLPSSCPPPVRINIQGRSYSLTWAYVCDFASGLSYVIVALAGLFFVTYVGRGFGGD